MKKILFLVVFAIVFSSFNLVNAANFSDRIEGSINIIDEKIDDNVLVPGQFGYKFKRFTESTRLFFTFSEKARAEYRMELMERRVMETRRVLVENKTEHIDDLVENYDKRLEEIEKGFERMREREKEEVQERVANMTQNHLRVLEGVLEQVPEQARIGIEKAINSSQRGHITAREAVARREGKSEEEIEGMVEDIKGIRRKPENISEIVVNESGEKGPDLEGVGNARNAGL